MNPALTPTSSRPKIVSRAEWLKARKELLAEEKALTRARDALSARRRRLPMVKLEKSYTFTSAAGPVTLTELFAGKRQLYVHHFMWNEEQQKHCPGCSQSADIMFNNEPFLAFLAERDTAFAAISRAPLERIETTKAEKGWKFPWVSSAGTDFNYDFHVTLDDSRAPIEYNYRNREELIAAGFPAEQLKGDWPAASVFLRDGDTVYHTYSTFARGADHQFTPYNFLDLTAYGRQENWEDSPEGWPQRPTYG